MAADFLPKTPLYRAPGYEFRFVRDRRGFLVRVSNPNTAIVLGIEWAFGAGDQAVTFVSRSGPDTYIEDYFSYYPQLHGMGITPGQERLPAHDVVEAAGFAHRGLDIITCFGCHSTGTVRGANGTVTPEETGVHCEACHGTGKRASREQRSNGGSRPAANDGRRVE